MALTITNIGVVTDATGAATLDRTGITLSVGDMAVLAVACDNNGGSGAAPTVSVSDNVGNTYTLRATTNFTAGVDNDGVSLYLFSSLITVAITNTDTITATFATSPTAKCMSGYEFSPSGGGLVPTIRETGAGATGTSTTPSITTGTCQVDDYICGFLAAETTNAFTADGDTTNGTWGSAINGLANGGAQTTSIRLYAQSKLQTTTTSTQTFNPTIANSRDWATNYFVVYESSSVSVNANATGVAGTTALGTVTVVGKANHTETGEVGTTALGTITVVGKANHTETGEVGTTALGTVTTVSNNNIPVTGLAGTTALGTATAAIFATAPVTGVAGTTSLGDETVVGKATTTQTGVTGTTALGTATVVAKAGTAVTGVTGTTALGTVTVVAAASTAVTGVVGTTSLGDETVATGASFSVTGVGGTTALGDETVAAGATASVTGEVGTTALGTVTVNAEDGSTVFASVTGVQATGGFGNLQVDLSGIVVYPLGVSASMNSPSTLVWGKIVPAQSSIWTPIIPTF